MQMHGNESGESNQRGSDAPVMWANGAAMVCIFGRSRRSQVL